MPTAKNHLPLIYSVYTRISVCVWALALALTCNHTLAEQVADGTSTAPVDQMSNDKDTGITLPASQRLAAEAQRLLAGIDAAPTPLWIDIKGKDVLAFWQEDMSGNPQGAVLLLHAEGHSPRWPHTLLNLHQSLPRFGWATLSIELPPPAALIHPPRPPISVQPPPPEKAEDATASTEADGADNQPSVVDETQVVHQEDERPTPSVEKPETQPTAPSAEEVEQAAISTIRAALDYLQQQNQTTIVILGEGLGAARALTFAAQARAQPINAIVMLDATMAEGAAYAPDQLLQRPEVPTLDLITSVDFEVRQRAAKRKQVSNKMQYKTYLVRNVLPQVGRGGRGEETDLSKTIRGFITRYAPSPE